MMSPLALVLYIKKRVIGSAIIHLYPEVLSVLLIVCCSNGSLWYANILFIYSFVMVIWLCGSPLPLSLLPFGAFFIFGQAKVVCCRLAFTLFCYWMVSLIVQDCVSLIDILFLTYNHLKPFLQSGQFKQRFSYLALFVQTFRVSHIQEADFGFDLIPL